MSFNSIKKVALSFVIFPLRRFKASAVKNVIVSQSPYITRLDTFMRDDWTNLEYLQLTGLGVFFAQYLKNTLNAVFRTPKPEVRSNNWARCKNCLIR